MAYFDVNGVTAVIYARVSTDDKDQRPEVQVDLCTDWCTKNGVNVIGVYTDKVTGTSLERPGFEQMLGKINTAKPGLLVVRDQSRLTRDMKLEEIKGMLAYAGTKIIYVVTPDIDPDSFVGQLSDSINGAINKQFIKDLSSRTSNGMEKSRELGIHIGTPARFAIFEDIRRMPKGKVRLEDFVDSKGKIHKATKVISENLLFLYAKQGRSLRYLAKTEGISHTTLQRYLKGTTEPSIPGDPDSIIPERYSEYLRVMNGGEWPKRETAVSDENPVSECSERGVEQKGVETLEIPNQKGGC